MTDETASPARPSLVRGQVLDQHAVIRGILERMLDATTNTLKREGLGMHGLAHLVHDLRTRFRAHLAFEERTLVPVLVEADLWGPQRVRELLDEHARQRAELDTLIEGIETDWDAERLALATRSLVADLLRDMHEEEESCLSADLLRDDVVNIDQATD